jgi:hypothetical protein
MTLSVMFLMFVATLCSAGGQSVFEGAISGTVTDQTGAVIKGATVQIVNEDTHFVTQTVSNDKGVYTASFLTPGNYDVKVQAATFGAQEQTDAVLIAGANKEVDFKLKPSANSQEVTVTANGELLETGTATINATIDSYLIENTPNTGDNVFYLSTRLPGVYSNFVQGSEKQNWTLASNGQIGGGNGVSNRTLVNYDGILDTTYQGNPGGSGGSGFSPPPFTTQELSVKTAEFDAQYGHTDGLVYDLVLKNGTPQFHGNAMITEENTVFDANAWQRNNIGLGRPTTNYTEEAFAVTGPLAIPGTRLHVPKTYFMFGFQHVRFNLPQQTSNVLEFTVPSVKERMGDFSELLPSGGIIYDPATTVPSGAPGTYATFCSPNCQQGQRESFTQEYSEGPGNLALCGGDTNCIPQSRWNAVGAALIGATSPSGYNQGIYPLPNISKSVPEANYLAAHYAFVTYYHGFVARIDHEFTDNTKMHVSFSRSVLNQISNDDQGFPDDELGSTYVQTARNEDITVADFTHVLSPTSVLDLHAGFYYHPVLVNRMGENFNPSNLGMNTSTLPASLQNFPGTGSLYNAAGGSYQGLQSGNGQIDHYYFEDNTAMYSKTLSRHNLKVGGEFLTMQDDTINTTSNLGTFSGGNGLTDNPCSSCAGRTTSAGDGLATLLLGYPTGSSATISPKPAYHWNYYASFAQDDWRVNNRFTLNAGLRYDYESPITERHDWMNAGFSTTASQPFCIPNASGTAISSCAPPPTVTPGSAGYFGGLTFVGNGVKMPFHRELLDRFQPRVGGAYRVTSRDVLRAGWGLTIGPGAQVQQNQGFSASTSYIVSPGSTSAGLTPALCTPAQGGDSSGFCTLTNPFPNGVVQPTGSLLGLSTFLGQNISIYDQNYAFPRTAMYVVDWEHQFPSQLLVDVSYHGANTAGLGISRNINALPACFYATINAQTQTWTPGGCKNAGINSALTASVANPMAGYLPPSSSLNGSTTQQQNLYLPYPEFGTITETFTRLNGKRTGVVNYNALYAEVTKRLTHGLDLHTSFTFAKVMDELSFTNAQDLTPAHYLDQQPSRLFELDGVYHFPELHGANVFMRQVTNGWVLAVSENWDQATGMGPISGYAWTGASVKAANQSQSHWFNTCFIPLKTQATVNAQGVVTPPTWYPAQGPGPAGSGAPCNAGENPAWVQLPAFTLGQQNSGTIMGNVIRFPEGAYLNASIGKMFPIHDRTSLELRADFQNVINNVVLIGSFSGTPTATTYGSDVGPTQNNDPRYFRVKAILSF